MYMILAVVAAVVSTVAVVWIFAKLKIFDLIGYFIPGCASFFVFRFLEVGSIFAVSLFFFSAIFCDVAEEHTYTDTYLTVKRDIKFLAETKIGKEKKYTALDLPKDTVLKVIDSKIKKDERILFCYAVFNGDNRLKKGTVKFPKDEAKRLKQDNDCYSFSSDSSFFRDYRNMASAKNEKITSDLQREFSEALRANGVDIVFIYRGNFFKKTWIRITRYTIPKNGFDYKSPSGKVYKGVFGKYPTEAGYFWYTESANKKKLLEIVNQFYEKLDRQLYELPEED
ncbi:MAG: hypothetical protein K6B43_13735 [Treponema sp.]|nr:hypothetical protein [Treponema sp.]